MHDPVGAIIVRVATATHQSIPDVMRAPYVLTLWTFFHLVQRDMIDQYNTRSMALYQGGLTAIAFHEPKKLADEERRHREALAPVEDPETARARALAFAAEVAKVDAVDGWVVLEEPLHG